MKNDDNFSLVTEIRTVAVYQRMIDWKGYGKTFYAIEMSYVLR